MTAKSIVHMIGQAHLDPVWLWRWTEGRAGSAGDQPVRRGPPTSTRTFTLCAAKSQIYKWIEEEDPALFAQIQELIRQGRWHVVNGMVIQPDMNIPQGESFVRQVLLGKASMQSGWAWNRASPTV